MQTLSLSPELCSRIVSFLAPPSSTPPLSSSSSRTNSNQTTAYNPTTLADLLALSLTCKAFQREAEPHLYSTVVLSDPQRVLGFARAVLENERLAGYVRTFVFNQTFQSGGHAGAGRGLGMSRSRSVEEEEQMEGVNLGQDFWTVIQLILEAIQWNVEVLILSDSSAGNTFVFDPPTHRVRRPSSPNQNGTPEMYWSFPALHTLKLRFTWDMKAAGFIARLACPPSPSLSSSPTSPSSPSFSPSSSKLKILHFHDTTDTLLESPDSYPDWAPGKLPPRCIPRNLEVFDGTLGVGIQLLPPPPPSLQTNGMLLDGDGDGEEEGYEQEFREDGEGDGDGDDANMYYPPLQNPTSPTSPFPFPPARTLPPPPTSSNLTHLQMVMDTDPDYALEEMEARLAYLARRGGGGVFGGGGGSFGLRLRALSLLDVPDDPVLVRGVMEVVGLYVGGVRHLGVLPYEQVNRHKFHAHLFPLTHLHTLELDLSQWQPAPTHPAAQRAVASELHTFCPSLRVVVLWVGSLRARWGWVCPGLGPGPGGVWVQGEEDGQGQAQGRGGNGNAKGKATAIATANAHGKAKHHHHQGQEQEQTQTQNQTQTQEKEKENRIYSDVSAQYGGPMGSWSHRVDGHQYPQFSTTWCGA